MKPLLDYKLRYRIRDRTIQVILTIAILILSLILAVTYVPYSFIERKIKKEIN